MKKMFLYVSIVFLMLTLFSCDLFISREAITYNGNGETSGSIPVDEMLYRKGQTVTVRGNTGDLVKDDYIFKEWNTQSTGSGANYSFGTTFEMGSAAVVLFAQWELPIEEEPEVERFAAFFDSETASILSIPDDKDVYTTNDIADIDSLYETSDGRFNTALTDQDIMSLLLGSSLTYLGGFFEPFIDNIVNNTGDINSLSRSISADAALGVTIEDELLRLTLGSDYADYQVDLAKLGIYGGAESTLLEVLELLREQFNPSLGLFEFQEFVDYFEVGLGLSLIFDMDLLANLDDVHPPGLSLFGRYILAMKKEIGNNYRFISELHQVIGMRQIVLDNYPAKAIVDFQIKPIDVEFSYEDIESCVTYIDNIIEGTDVVSSFNHLVDYIWGFSTGPYLKLTCEIGDNETAPYKTLVYEDLEILELFNSLTIIDDPSSTALGNLFL